MARTALLREPEAAEYLGLSLRSLRDRRYKRLIPYVRLGTSRNASVRYRLGDLDRFIDAHKVEAV